MLWQIIFLAAGILSLIYYGAICIALEKMGLYIFPDFGWYAEVSELQEVF